MSLVRRALRLLRDVVRHPANRHRRARAALAVLGWQFWKRVVRRPVIYRLPWGSSIRCYPHSTSTSLAIYTRGWVDPNEMRLVTLFLRRGDVAVDVGANIGLYTLLCAHIVGDSGHVFSFEPGHPAIDRLRENVRLNRYTNVTIHAAAVGDKDGTVSFTPNNDATNRILLSGGSSASSVTCVRLDSILTDVQLAFVKIDVEGAEPLVLNGAERAFRRNPPSLVLLEANGRHRDYGFERGYFRDWASAHNYVFLDFEDKRIRLTPILPIGENLFLLHRVAIPSARERILALNPRLDFEVSDLESP